MKEFKNEAEVESEANSTHKNLIIFEGTVYDVADYVSQHPGGSEKILDLVGKSIDAEFEEAEHSTAARKIFNDLTKVGYMEGTQKKEDVSNSVAGLDGFKLEANVNFNYNEGFLKQLWKKDFTFD